MGLQTTPEGQTFQKQMKTYRDVILPLIAVAETIGTAAASKGHFVGKTALGQQQRLTQQAAAEEEARERAIERAQRGELIGAQTELTRAKIGALGGGTQADYTPEELMELTEIAALPETDPTKIQRAQTFQARKFPKQFITGVLKPTTEKTPETFKNESTLRKEFNSLSGEFNKVRDAYKRILSVTGLKTGASDLALIFNYMKMLDPGSVVRESEFATAENAAGVPQMIRRVWNKVRSGQKLEDTQRAQFVQAAQSLFGKQAHTQQQNINRYTNIATRENLNPANVVESIEQALLKKVKIPTAKAPKPVDPKTASMIRKANAGDPQAQEYLNSIGVEY